MLYLQQKKIEQVLIREKRSISTQVKKAVSVVNENRLIRCLPAKPFTY